MMNTANMLMICSVTPDGVRRVLLDVAGDAADADAVGRDRAERQQGKDESGHPEERRAHVVAELEGGDLAEHDVSPQAARRTADSVEK